MTQENKHTPPSELTMPLQDWREVQVPFGLLNEEWAQLNHDQTLLRLRERGGLGVNEALAIIGRHVYVQRDSDAAKTMLHQILKGYNIGIASAPALLAEVEALKAENENP